MRKTLEAKYDHLQVEMDHYKSWIEHGYFTQGIRVRIPSAL